MDEKVVLIVDDDMRLRRLLKAYLEKNGFLSVEAATALDAEDLLQYFRPDVVIMDVMMPQKNGDVFTKELRQRGEVVPILILTAKGDTESRISGLEAGADDYLSKPFEPKELLLRINNLLKRRQQNLGPVFQLGAYTYQAQLGVLKKADEVISLTQAEKVLLDVLLQHLNQEVSREQLAEWMKLDNTRTVDVQITRLRKKLNGDTQAPLIQTIRGKGYRLIST